MENYDYGSVKIVSEERLVEMRLEMLNKCAWMRLR